MTMNTQDNANRQSDGLGLEPDRAFEAWAFDQPDFTTQQPWDVAHSAYMAGRADRLGLVERLRAMAEHLRHCRECGETDVANCPEGEALWDACMPQPAAELGA